MKIMVAGGAGYIGSAPFSIATPLPGTRLYKMVGEEISPFQYSLLYRNGSDLTEKLNKSGIRDVIRRRRKLRNKYLMRSVRKSILSTRIIGFIVLRENCSRRLRAVFDFLRRTTAGGG